MSNIFALLVGINDYAPEVGKLAGCLNDVDHFHDFLEADFDPGKLNVEVLKDADATRDNIIRLFDTHLGRAGADDVALFHYSGHGARWASASAFHKYYPDRKDEGLVCYDSRRSGGYDLADKELAVLIARLAEKDPHIAVVFDCCHSGSGTRGVDDIVHLKARQTHEVFEERPLESYLGGYFAQLEKDGRPLTIPESRHILLAACERTQKAWENREHRGVFTFSMLEVLEKLGSAVSYAELFTSCRAAVRERADNQNPQFDCYSRFNSNSGFLGKPARRGTKRYGVSHSQGWYVDCGAVHGLPTDPQKSVTMALYPENDPESLAGHATTTGVGAQRSTLEIDFPGEIGARYRAEVTSLPATPIPVYLRGDPAALATLVGGLEQDGSVGVEFVNSPVGTRYEVFAADKRLQLLEREPVALIQGAEGYSEHAAGYILAALKNLAAWERGLMLQNSGTLLDTSQVDFWFSEILPDGNEHHYSEADDEAGTDPLRHIRRVTIDFSKEGNNWRRIPGAFRARNRTDQTLHLALFYFSLNYGIYQMTNNPVPPGDDEVVLWESGAKQCFFLPEDENEALDRFKLIVSTEKVDDFLLTQSDVKTGEIHPAPLGGEIRTGARAVDGFGKPERKKYRDEWFTKMIEVKIVRQADRIGSEDTSLADRRITIKGHPSVTANLSLTSARAGSRTADSGSGIYEALERLPAASGEGRPFQLVDLGGGRSAGSPIDASVLELTDIQNAEALAEQPLEIELDVPLEENEGLLPLTFDGEHLLLGGDAYTDDSGVTHVSVDHLPDIPDNRRSLGEALKLYFFKTYLKRETVNRLRWVEFRDDGTVDRRGDGVAEQVDGAQNILLLVHGIIGDTEGMARGLRLVSIEGGQSLDQEFDLVLTYDYENLTTPIEETAADLKRQLETVGLRSDDDRRLTLLVHSMGGLVSRWLIEQMGGSTLVDHLVMCGTPNCGSPFGQVGAVRKIFSVLTTVALNYFPAMAPLGSTVLFVLNRSKKVTPTLEQMSPSSEFIGRLNTGVAPPIPYTVLAGDIDAFEADSDGLFSKLLTKASKGRVLAALFGSDHHDIAVRVDSIRDVAPASKSNIACHHLNYFSSKPGLQALAAVTWRD